MTIRREDLAAAAALGLLQYRQVDPLLLFLLQRDVLAQRRALFEASRQRRAGALTWLTVVAGVMAALAGALFALLLTQRGPELGVGVMLIFLAAYGASAFSAVALVRARGYGRRVRIVSAALMASVPLAVFALQQVG